MKNIRNWMLFAMVLLFFDVHIGIVNLLPNWAGYLILAYCAKKMMAEKGGLTAALGICVAVLRLGYRHFAAAGKRRSMDPAENIIDVDYEYEDIKVTGVIGKPVIARSNRSNQLFFVNKRYIKDKVLTSAAEQGYKGLLT